MQDRPNRNAHREHIVTRRRFLAASAGIAATTVVPRHLLGGPGFVPPSERLRVAVIGTGGRGKRLTSGFLGQKDVEIVAIADPNERESYARFYYRGVSGRLAVKELIEKHYAASRGGEKGAYAGCRDFVDYREMFDKEKSIDAVVVATPDHVHAFAALAAIRLGKHVYCEKPLCHSVEEVRQVTLEARRAKIATQMGNQGNSSDDNRLTQEWVRDGAIGEVREVHAWSATGSWTGGRTARPKDTPPVPKGLDWKMWLGPAKHRPYHPAYAPYNWRGWLDFGTGAIGDMACHNIDPAFAALRLGAPDTIEAETRAASSETTPVNTTVRFEFPARGKLPPVTLTWYDGSKRPPRPEGLAPGAKLDGNGVYLVGSKGVLLSDGWSRNPRLLPDSMNRSYKRPPKTIPRVAGHDRAWIDACKGGPPASSNFDYSGPLAELVLLGVVAQRTGEKLRWDGPNLRVTNCPDAEQYVRQEYRKGWTL